MEHSMETPDRTFDAAFDIAFDAAFDIAFDAAFDIAFDAAFDIAFDGTFDTWYCSINTSLGPPSPKILSHISL